MRACACLGVCACECFHSFNILNESCMTMFVFHEFYLCMTVTHRYSEASLSQTNTPDVLTAFSLPHPTLLHSLYCGMIIYPVNSVSEGLKHCFKDNDSKCDSGPLLPWTIHLPAHTNWWLSALCTLNYLHNDCMCTVYQLSIFGICSL